jgi:lipoprotein-releasing system permease protein
MITALLVLILERTYMVGVLRALGASSWLVRKVFVINAMYLVGRGLLIGNVIGLGLIAIQHYFEPLKLDPDSYYVSVAPVSINLLHILSLNVGTFVVCMLALILPTYLVSTISPVKAMRFE